MDSDFLLKMPKVELHMHLDGSVPFSVLEKLSGLPIGEVFAKAVSVGDTTLLNYLKRFDFINKYIKTKDDLELISYSLGKELKKENVIYAEVRFAPIDYVSNTLIPDDVIKSVLNGFAKCKLKTNLILCMRRGASLDYNMQTIKLAKKFLNKGVVAIDLVGAEGSYSFKKYKDLFNECKRLHIPCTIHSGEETKKEIKDVIKYAKRIGHGIQIIDDPKLIDLVKENKILLEVCPNSNLDTRNARDYHHHPVKKLYDMGVKVCINTDNRTVSNITLTEEYENLIHYLGFTVDDLYKMNYNAIEYAFISKIEKKILRKKLQKKESQK